VCVISGAGVWIVVSIAVGFPARWETIFQTLVAALTLTMVFVIQHTQARHQRATQRKLDEILRAMPSTDNSLLTLEHASDEGGAPDLPDCGSL
jgi:low affinity Fe/Cu permease